MTGVALTLVGGDGIELMVMEVDAAETVDVPVALVAVTVKV